jgi:hypothetical protein
MDGAYDWGTGAQSGVGFPTQEYQRSLWSGVPIRLPSRLRAFLFPFGAPVLPFLRRMSAHGEAEPSPSRDYVEASHSHERHTVHGLHEQKSHEQDVPCGDGNNGCRLCSSGQSFQPIDKPARHRQNL